MPSVTFLFAAAGLLFALALAAPPHLILVPDLLLAIFPWQWEVSGVQIDVRDVAFLAVAAGVAMHWGPKRAAAVRQIPNLRLWFGYVLLASLAYVYAPTSQIYLTGPLELAYQVYRYCWKPCLYYLIAAVVLVGPQSRRSVLAATVLASDFYAFVGIAQGYAGMDVVGTFGEGGQKNALASALLIPMMLCLKGVFEPETRAWRLFHFGSLLVLMRALLIAGSRGAFLAAVVGVGCFLLGATRVSGGMRRKVTRLVGAGMVCLLLMFAWNPSLSDRPALEYTLSARKLTKDDTFQWRLQERWPHFIAMTLEHPLLGRGTDVDLTLSTVGANTPHNAFLSIAVSQGIPAAVVFISFVVLAIRNGLRIFRRAAEPGQRLLGLAASTSVLALTINSMVDAAIILSTVLTAFWMVLAIVGVDAAALARGHRPARRWSPSELPAMESPVNEARP